jgi:hypothetical protein
VSCGRLWKNWLKDSFEREVCSRRVGGCVLRNLRVEMNRSEF